jgi:O-antigen/teichoic acid export membrane protein
METVTQGFCFTVTIILAYILHNIWAFIIGILLTEILKIFYSYYYLRGGVVGIALDKKYTQEIIKFGKWIFLATAFTFIIGEGNKLIFGIFLSKRELGIYHVASMIALVPIALIGEYNKKITLPRLTFTYNYKISDFVQEFERGQNVTLLSFLTLACLLMLSGNLIITTLYNENYFEAGKVFTVLMMAVCFNTIFFSISPIFLSIGNSFYHMLNQKIYGINSIGFGLLGYYMNDYFGLLYGLAIASFFQTFITLLLARRLIAIKYKNTLLSVITVTIFVIISQFL